MQSAVGVQAPVEAEQHATPQQPTGTQQQTGTQQLAGIQHMGTQQPGVLHGSADSAFIINLLSVGFNQADIQPWQKYRRGEIKKDARNFPINFGTSLLFVHRIARGPASAELR